MPIALIKLNNGRCIPAIGLGTSQFQDRGGIRTPNSDHTQEAVESAIDAGYRHFDTAFSYHNEGQVGTAVRRKIEQGVVTREDLFITTKLYNTFNRPEHVLRGLLLSLAALQLDYVDLYLIHLPISMKYIGTLSRQIARLIKPILYELYISPLPTADDVTEWPRDAEGNIWLDDVDLADTWRAMEKLVELGLARSIGVSNFNVEQLQHILDHCTITPATNQVECHAYLMQQELFKFCQEHAITVTAYAPCGSPARWDKGQDEPVLTRDPVVVRVADRLGKSPTQVLIRYLVERGRIAIPRSMNPAHIQQNLDVMDFDCSPEDLLALDGLDRNLRFFPRNIS